MIDSELGHIDDAGQWDYAVVLQGPYHKGMTDKAIEIFLNRNHYTVIIVSTTSLEVKEEACLQIKLYPGRLVFLFVKVPPVENLEFWRTNRWNQNLQRLTSFMGLEYAERLGIPYSMKMRSDAFLGMFEVCDYLVKNFTHMYPILHRDDVPIDPERLKNRITIGEYSSRLSENKHIPNVCEHDICDFWFFGHTTDVLNYFNIRGGSTWNGGSGITLKFFPETNICEVWMRDMGIPLSMEVGEMAGRYLAIPSSIKVEFNWLGRWHRDHHRYLIEGEAYLRECFQKEASVRKLLCNKTWLSLIRM